MNRFFALITCLLLFGCATPDGGDMDALRRLLGKMSESTLATLRKGVSDKLAWKWLKDKSPNQLVSKMQCREMGADGKWGDWKDSDADLPPEFNDWEAPGNPTVQWFLDALHLEGWSYFDAALRYNQRVKTQGAYITHTTGKKTECQVVWQPGFDLFEEVPDNVRDPDEVTNDDIIKELLRSAEYAPLLELGPEGGAIEELLPALCPLTADPRGWGCPSDPDSPPQQPVPGDK